MVIQGTYWCEGFRASVFMAFWCIRLFPRSPFTQDITLSQGSDEEYSCRHWGHTGP